MFPSFFDFNGNAFFVCAKTKDDDKFYNLACCISKHIFICNRYLIVSMPFCIYMMINHIALVLIILSWPLLITTLHSRDSVEVIPLTKTESSWGGKLIDFHSHTELPDSRLSDHYKYSFKHILLSSFVRFYLVNLGPVCRKGQGE